MVAGQELKQVPDTPAEMAEMLRRASEQKLSVALRGAGTKLDWGRQAQRVDARACPLAPAAMDRNTPCRPSSDPTLQWSYRHFQRSSEAMQSSLRAS
jgi:hypothetical protein